MKYALIAVVVLMSWGQPTAAETYTVLGSGNETCGAWTKSSRKETAIHWQREQWVFGFITSARIWLQHDTGSEIDLDGMTGWVDNYCRDNLLNSLTSASIALLEALQNRSLSR